MPPVWAGSTAKSTAAATSPITASGTISFHRRRVATETRARLAGPPEKLETALNAVTSRATGIGYCRRHCTRTKAMTPSTRSTASHHGAVRTWLGAVAVIDRPDSSSITRIRQVWLHHVSGGCWDGWNGTLAG